MDFCSIPPFAFYGCEKLIDEFDVDTIGEFGLYGCVSVTAIKANKLDSCAAAYCKTLKQVVGVDELSQGALWNCCSLNCFDTSNLKTIGAFGLGRSAVQQLTFKGRLIGDFALFSVNNLRSVKIASQISIGKSIFYKCDAIKEMDIFGSKKLSFYFAGEVPQVETLVLHGDIPDDFCRNNPYLKLLTLEDVQHFGRWSFYNNSALKTVIMKNVKSIGDWAFAYCDGIAKIQLPKETEFIGMNAFRYCHNLSEIKIMSNSVVMFGANAFYSIAEDKNFKVPFGLRDKYADKAIWQGYIPFIEELTS